MENRNKIESVLFILGRPVSVPEIASLTSIGSQGLIAQKLLELKDEYSKRQGPLELVNEADKWKLCLKKEYLYLSEKLLSDSELDFPTQETLAVIAYKQPVLQAEIIKIRGNKAYDHIHFLKESSFVTSEKSGRTRMLKLTQKFFDYFDVVDNNLKLKNE
ncbi:MAG: SMC-Scp complex subunit ScpB [Candidatus Nanoarchaeia archaeon]|nr:SMC-Scp complex subunit ScpB [Candidatus Nanoarchaeia archaeon]MDD5587678.1 SMC-Scp complex subunit ScpB [Candidatus Nanoarchaeia archaeon]